MVKLVSRPSMTRDLAGEETPRRLKDAPKPERSLKPGALKKREVLPPSSTPKALAAPSAQPSAISPGGSGGPSVIGELKDRPASRLPSEGSPRGSPVDLLKGLEIETAPGLSGGSGPLAAGAVPGGTPGPKVVGGGGLPGSMTTSPPKEGLVVLGVPGGKGSGAGTGMGGRGGSKRSAQDLVQGLGIGEAAPGPSIIPQPEGSTGGLASGGSGPPGVEGPKVVGGGGLPGAMSVSPSKGGLGALKAPGGKGDGTGSRGSKRSAQELVQGLGLGETPPGLPSLGEGFGTGKPKAVEGLVTKPDYSANPRPPYPRIARENRYEGTVFLKIWVLENGKVGTLKIERSSGYNVLDKAALEAVKGWTFIPARRNGVPIAAWVVVPIRFQLD